MVVPKSFRRPVVALASLLALAHAGCIPVPTPTPRQDPFAGLGLDPESRAYPGLSLALLVSENTRNAMAYAEQGSAWAAFDSQKMLEADVDIFKRNFRTVVRVQKFEAAADAGADLVAVLDVYAKVGRRIMYDKKAVFFSLDRRELATAAAKLDKKYTAWSPGAVGRYVEQFADEARRQWEAELRSAPGLREFARSRGAAPASAAAPAPAAPAFRSDVDQPPRRLPEDPTRFALVVGIERYKDLPEARFAGRDAAAMVEHLLALGYPRRNIIHLADQNATTSGLEKYLGEWLPRNAKAGSTVFFYYSGHGAPDPATGEAYLVPWDGDPQFLASTAYPLQELYSALAELPAKKVVAALDACFSGAGGRSVLARGVRPLVTKVDSGAVPAGRMAVFAAASGDQVTGALEEQGHGLFTYFFLKGLSGEAGKGPLTARGLYDYLKPRVQDEASRQNRDQTPALLGGPSDLPVAP